MFIKYCLGRLPQDSEGASAMAMSLTFFGWKVIFVVYFDIY